MDLFYLASKLGALLLGAISTLKLTSDWLYGSQGRLREEYKFAKEFLNHLSEEPLMHPFLKQKGYQAIAGDTQLTALEIEYLLTLHDSARALKDYVLGRLYLKHFATAAESQITFLPKYKARWPRLWRKTLYFILYMLFFSCAFSPLLLPTLKSLQSIHELGLLAITFTLFMPPGFLALRAGVRITRAEALVANQHKHSQGILLA
jgi:hypothetical protein